ncbi:Na/Pi cotransporter family protein [Anabaena subtropica]|uniref:Na/Pi cotransporter family protein n=1 Tax=Anabaena subtropica FACHB-260 TaxID=2692884 RepID=A0ABR8CPH8_9NOST|nr:Na/Pi symporter [Anabaena subtropica]MBD2343710.1 Na/Pi cotransporter family protein [Anabaena subtropica FACHB-260]
MFFKKIIIKFIFLLILSLFLFIGIFNLKNDFYAAGTESSIIRQQVTAISVKKIENQQQFQKTETIGVVNQLKAQEELNIFHIVMGVMAGLVLFLYGVAKMAEGMETLAGDRVRNILRKFTTNPLGGVITGSIVTTILDSSSVTIIIVIAMVSAGLLTYLESLGVVLGSNIGTAFGVQVVAFNIDEYAPIALFMGFLLSLLGKNERLKQIGLIVLGIGLLFFGLGYIENATAPFRDYPQFINWMENLGHNTLQGALVGGLFTVLIQSSSATVAIVVTLASQGLISLPTGIALMLGAEIGTCADTLVATIGRKPPAIRTGLFHFLFNFASVTVGLLFASQLAALSLWVSTLAGAGDNVARQIANAQLIFNLLGVLLVLGFLPWIARGLERLIPD